MSPQATVKEFCKRNGMIANGANGVPMLSKKHQAGAMWIECFDSWADALEFLKAGEIAYRDLGKVKPWEVANVK